MTKKIETIVLYISSPVFFFVLLIITMIIAFGITISSPNISFGSVDFTESGWALLFRVYKAPFSVFVVGTTTWGIFLAVRRTYQLEKQIELTNKQYKLFEHNIAMNNYYKHLDEFIKVLVDYRKSRALWGSHGSDADLDLYRELYYLWFGRKYKSSNMISKEVIENVKKLCTLVIEEFKYPEKHVSKPIHDLLKIIGFEKKIRYDDIYIGRRSITGLANDALKLCKRILIFSDQINEVKEIDTVIELLNPKR